MKKIIAMVLSVCCLGMMMTACNNKTEVNISGSSSVTPLMEALAAEFEKQNKDVAIIITQSDSTTGISDVEKGNSELGMASRALKATETAVEGKTLCYDGITVVVGNEVSLTGVTKAQLVGLYKDGVAIDTITHAVSREAGSGTRDAFDGIVFKGVDGMTFGDNVSISNNTGAVMTAVNSDAKKLGYISLGSLNNTVKSIQYEGVSATIATILDGSYKLSRPFVIATKKGAKLSDGATKFMEFVASEKGQAIIAQKGYVKLAK